MLPIKDINRPLTTPHVNRMLILTNVIVFLVMLLSDLGVVENRFAASLGENFAMYPYYIIRGERLYTLLTSMFLHAGLFHLFGNMLFLYIFGDNVEGVFGHVGYLIFYLFCGLAASFTYILTLPYFDPLESVVGASGAISGVLGAYLILYPKAKVLTLVTYVILPLPAIVFLGFWFVMQWFYAFFEVGGNVAWWAHIGGFIAGMFLALIFGLGRKKVSEARMRL